MLFIIVELNNCTYLKIKLGEIIYIIINFLRICLHVNKIIVILFNSYKINKL